MEKKLFFILLAAGLGLSAQTYVPMPLKNCYWTITYQKMQAPGSSYTGPSYVCYYQETYAVYPDNDTIINAKRYIKFYREFINDNTTGTNCTYTYSPSYSDGYMYAVRQDTAAQKIYYILPSQSAEKLLYDFNYVAGDSVKTALGTFNPPPPCNGSPYRIIQSVSTQTLGDGWPHRIYKLKPYQAGCTSVYPFNDTIIEGVGNEIGVAELLKSNPQVNSWQITVTNVIANCLVVNNTTAIYSRGPANCNYPLGIINPEKNKPGLYPNPSSGYLELKNHIRPGEKIKITIVNATGIRVKEVESDNERIDVRELSSGIYFLLLQKNDECSTLKFIRE